MSIRAILAVSLALLAIAVLPLPAAAQAAAPLAGGVVNSGPGREVVVVQPAGFAQTAVTSCAGGAIIGYLAVLATGGMTPVGTAALFCGLSVAATTASTVTAWTWHKTTSFIY